jgi:CO dehydrogenase/acetyl-CoA synthase epsilon subunit
VRDEKPATQYHHTMYEIEGDMQELAELENSDLIDKKVIKRATESALILDPTMTLSEEVSEYLTFILQLPQSTVENVLKEMQNYADRFEQ